MIKTYLKTAIRYLTDNITFTLVNIIGLSVGISAFILLFLYVHNELTYDRFHENGDHIYRICENNMEYTKGLVLDKLMEDYPEVINGTRFMDWDAHMVSYSDKEFMQDIFYVDTGFFDVFSFPFLYGSVDDACKEKNTVVISRKLSEKYFGNENPVGKTLSVDFGENNLLVTAVVDEIPNNSTLQFDMLVSYETGFLLSPWMPGIHDWYNTFSQTYVQLAPNTDVALFEDKIQQVVKDHFLSGSGSPPRLNLLPISELHDKVSDNKAFVFMLICIAVGILLIATINFINLSTAGAVKRSLEVGLRKVLGAGKNNLLTQFFGESLLLSFLGLIVAMLITNALLPFFNNLFQTDLHLFHGKTMVALVILLAIWLITGFVSGAVPAIIMTKFNVIASLKKQVLTSKKSQMYRSSLVVFQLVLSIILISGTLFIYKQIGYMKNQDLRFDQENVVVIEPNIWQYKDSDAAMRKVKMIADELKNDTRIVGIAASEVVPGRYIENYNMFYPEAWSEAESVHFRHGWVSPDYFKTYGIPLEESLLNDDLHVDSNAIVINSTGLKELKTTLALGNILHSSSKTGTPFKIVGIASDFHYMGLNRKIQPVLHYIRQEPMEDANFISIRVRSGEMEPVLKLLKKKWTTVEPANELSFFFADDEINKDYFKYERIKTVVGYFTVLAILVACLGLFALTSFMGKQRTKEIGIRKTNGAKSVEIIAMLISNNVKWVAVAFLFACPVAWMAMHKWLEEFAYKTPLTPWIFALAGLLVLFVSLATVSYQSWQVAKRNPVEALRYE